MKEAWKKAIWNFYFCIVEYYQINPESSQIDFTFLIQMREAMMKNNIQDALKIISNILQFYGGQND